MKSAFKNNKRMDKNNKYTTNVRDDREGKTLIGNKLTFEDIMERKIFIILNESMDAENKKLFDGFTKTTGIKFKVDRCEGFCVIKKVE